jgi:hypothetical protein
MKADIRVDQEAAIRDLEDRTLTNLPGKLTRLVYLSSTRDYNTGEYQHAGLADRFGAVTAQKALQHCHESVFEEILAMDLADLVQQLAQYIETTGAERDKVLDTWRRLQAYRLLVPAGCDELTADLFASNVKIALEVLRIDPAPTPAE